MQQPQQTNKHENAKTSSEVRQAEPDKCDERGERATLGGCALDDIPQSRRAKDTKSGDSGIDVELTNAMLVD